MSDDEPGNERTGENDPPYENLTDFQSRLRRLKCEGCNLLVVGGPPREVFTRASEAMLGDPDARRWRVFALTDATPQSVYDRLPATSAAPRPPSETTRIVNHALPPRPITDDVDSSVATVPEVSVSDANLAGLRTELCEAIDDFGARSHRPAEVRLAVDSLAPLLDNYEFDVVRRCLRAVGERVYEHDAMAHYVLPEPYDSQRCQRLEDEFDAVVELRTGPEGREEAEERWRFPGADATTPWVPL
jgi:hypothetical protein